MTTFLIKSLAEETTESKGATLLNRCDFLWQKLQPCGEALNLRGAMPPLPPYFRRLCIKYCTVCITDRICCILKVRNILLLLLYIVLSIYIIIMVKLSEINLCMMVMDVQEPIIIKLVSYQGVLVLIFHILAI